jgi:hypothetical protein
VLPVASVETNLQTEAIQEGGKVADNIVNFSKKQRRIRSFLFLRYPKLLQHAQASEMSPLV